MRDRNPNPKTPSVGRTALFLVVVLVAFAVVVTQAPSIIAGAILRPARVITRQPAPAGCRDRDFEGAGIMLRGWYCEPGLEARGTIVVLHGVADNRASATHVIARFTKQGLGVVAYDGRAHGQSGGAFCTYGFYEKEDLRRVIAALPPGPVILLGTSLGGAVALQAAAREPRVTSVVAAEVFSDLATVVRERAPRLTPDFVIRHAFRIAGERGDFDVEQVSPEQAAASIRVPVLLIHGAEDRDTGPDHARRILAALQGEKRLLLVNGAGHNASLSGPNVWSEIEAWVQRQLPKAQFPTPNVSVPGR
jgi:pimeloyl-ACP methyl ester carboxylesterase